MAPAEGRADGAVATPWPAERVLAAVAASGGPALARRLAAMPLPAPAAARRGLCPPGAGAALDCDVLVLGGGLSLLVAAALSVRGLGVVVVERQREVAAHRAWNASAGELQVLVAEGLMTQAQLEQMVVARYRRGICRWHGHRATEVTDVLDCALDAQRLLEHAAWRLQASGGKLLLGQTATASAPGPYGAAVQLRGAGAGDGAGDGQVLSARVVVDARGFQSPHAAFDLICPTVGGLVEGLEPGCGARQMDATTGEILATCEGIEDGHQHIWEAFPAGPGKTAVYLFYYARRQQVSPGALLDLYGRFFARLADYKAGPARLVTPTFGYIPGSSRLGPQPRPPHPRLLLVGDAAGRQSPLTFCGFGAMLRHLPRVVARCQAIVAWPAALGARQASGLPAVEPGGEGQLHAATGLLAWLMATLPERPQLPACALNELLAEAFAGLARMGPDAYRELLRDQMRLPAFATFLWRTSRRHPQVWSLVARSLPPQRLAAWAGRLAYGCWQQRIGPRYGVSTASGAG